MTIMLVDDKPIIPVALRYLLETVGVESESFEASLDALEAFRTSPRRYDAMVTDLAMPIMRGTDLAREFRTIQPGFPVVIVSGFLDVESSEWLNRKHALEFLPKPASLDDILRALRDQGLEVPPQRFAAFESPRSVRG